MSAQNNNNNNNNINNKKKNNNYNRNTLRYTSKSDLNSDRNIDNHKNNNNNNKNNNNSYNSTNDYKSFNGIDIKNSTSTHSPKEATNRSNNNNEENDAIKNGVIFETKWNEYPWVLKSSPFLSSNSSIHHSSIHPLSSGHPSNHPSIQPSLSNHPSNHHSSIHPMPSNHLSINLSSNYSSTFIPSVNHKILRDKKPKKVSNEWHALDYVLDEIMSEVKDENDEDEDGGYNRYKNKNNADNRRNYKNDGKKYIKGRITVKNRNPTSEKLSDKSLVNERRMNKKNDSRTQSTSPLRELKAMPRDISTTHPSIHQPPIHQPSIHQSSIYPSFSNHSSIPLPSSNHPSIQTNKLYTTQPKNSLTSYQQSNVSTTSISQSKTNLHHSVHKAPPHTPNTQVTYKSQTLSKSSPTSFSHIQTMVSNQADAKNSLRAVQKRVRKAIKGTSPRFDNGGEWWRVDLL